MRTFAVAVTFGPRLLGPRTELVSREYVVANVTVTVRVGVSDLFISVTTNLSQSNWSC